VPNLVTTTPGSIVDTAAAGSSYGRLNTAFAAYGGSWRVGDKYIFNFDGVVSNNTALRFEFSNGSATAPLLGLQFVIVNAGNNADSVQINSLTGSFESLFDNNNLGGAGGVGLAQRVVGNLTVSILSGGATASVTGTLADSTGTLWSGPTGTINLGTAPSSLFAAMNLNTSAGVSGITTLGWTLTPIPEPSTVALLTGLGLAGLMIRRRLTKKS
jgi:hypothetical protein